MSFFGRKKDPSSPQDTSVPPDPLAWQRRWHQILDACEDHPDEDADDKGVPDPLPDIDRDFRLLFNFWTGGWTRGVQARKQAFSIFPRGDLLLARIETYLSTPSMAIDADHATMILRKGVDLTQGLGFETPDPFGPVRVFNPSAISLQDAFAQADPPFIHLRDAMGDMAEKETGQAGVAAYYFLSEPLYRLATTYDVSRWILWPLCSNATAADDPSTAACLLWNGGWSAGWDKDGLFLFDRRKEFGLVA